MNEIPGSAARELDDLLTVLPHEISTPLTVIGGYAEMLREHCADDAQAMVAITAIERNAEILNALVTDLADARDETMVITAEPVDLVDVLEQVRDVMRDRLAARDVTWQLPPRPCAVELDPDSFGRAVRNLVDNATKFSEPDTPIEVRVTADDTEMTIRITDHGPGIADEARTQLFRRFARLDSTRRGLGLGLHVTRRIIRAHAGDVTHEPTPTRGATFVVRMPRRPSRGIR